MAKKASATQNGTAQAIVAGLVLRLCNTMQAKVAAQAASATRAHMGASCATLAPSVSGSISMCKPFPPKRLMHYKGLFLVMR